MREVASHLFCHNCFDELLAQAEAKKDDPPPKSVRHIADEAPDSRPLSTRFLTKDQCAVCHQHFTPEAVHEVGQLKVCERCKRAFTFAPKSRTVARNVSFSAGPAKPPAPRVLEAQNAEREEPAAAMEPKGSTPGSGATHCASCARRMPGPGSYHLIGDKPYCSNCVAEALASTGLVAPPKGPLPNVARPAAAAANHAATPAEGDPPSDSMPVADQSCDCCSRRLLAGNWKVVEGFWLCLGCSGTDEKAALTVARQRRRRLLEGLAREAGGSGSKTG